MLNTIASMVVRLFGATMRTLWSGTPSATFGAFIAIVVVAVIFTASPARRWRSS